MRDDHRVSELNMGRRVSDDLEIVGHDNRTVVLPAEAKWRNDPVDSERAPDAAAQRCPADRGRS